MTSFYEDFHIYPSIAIEFYSKLTLNPFLKTALASLEREIIQTLSMFYRKLAQLRIVIIQNISSFLHLAVAWCFD